jgi:hypothetical protein
MVRRMAEIDNEPETVTETFPSSVVHEGSIADTVDMLRGDHLLGHMVQIMNAFGDANAGMSVTLTVGGHLVEGVLCGIDEYLASQADRVRGLSDQERDFADLLTRLLETERENVADERDDRPTFGPTPRYVHVKQAYVDGLGPLPAWRGRLSQVTGWCLGARE